MSLQAKKYTHIAMLLLCVACDKQRVYEQVNNFKNQIWHSKNKVFFEFDIVDKTKPYNLYYTIRNNLDFPFSRIFVEYTLREKNDSLFIKKELTSIYLFDKKTGEPYGKSGLGDVFYHRFPLLKNYHFKKEGTYIITLEHFNRRENLSGVVSNGLRIEYAILPK